MACDVGRLGAACADFDDPGQARPLHHPAVCPVYEGGGEVYVYTRCFKTNAGIAAALAPPAGGLRDRVRGVGECALTILQQGVPQLLNVVGCWLQARVAMSTGLGCSLSAGIQVIFPCSRHRQ